MIQAFYQSIKTIQQWQQVDMIPVALDLLKEKLSLLESGNNTNYFDMTSDLLEEIIQAYWAVYRRWTQSNLNPKQKEWLSEIRDSLNSLEKISLKHH